MENLRSVMDKIIQLSQLDDCKNRLSEFEFKFIQDSATRVHQYGDNLKLSDKQIQLVENIFSEKILGQPRKETTIKSENTIALTQLTELIPIAQLALNSISNFEIEFVKNLEKIMKEKGGLPMLFSDKQVAALNKIYQERLLLKTKKPSKN